MAGDKTTSEDVRSSRVIRVVFLALLLDLLGFTLILPLLPSILDHYSQTGSVVDWFREAVGVPMETKYNSVLFGGLIGSLYSLLQFLSSPITGALSDDYGRKPLLLFTIFLLSRVVGGICKGNVSLCTAIVADLPCPKARNKGMAMIGVAFSLGFTLGPLMGAYFALRLKDAEVFYQGPAMLAGASESSGVQQSGDLLHPVALFNFSAVTRTENPPSEQKMQNLKVLGLVYFTYLFLFSGLEFTLSFLTHQRFQFSSMQQGKMFFFIGITMAVIQGGYARRIKPGHQIQTVSVAIISLIPAFLLIGIAWNLTLLYSGLFLYSFAAAIVVPCLSTQVSGHVYWLAGAELCFVISSAFFIVPLILLSRLRRQKEE
ncbi:Major facilitator superfamily domain-containing protein 10 [Labeo rohita]|uniref:Major facilitator superfamily domain-containing protein 10 n=1 Tax=Labeo rohita TaxID=84645 RepID=A0ABQ8MNG7_LABRO|nr:Major facilitator superfamily domain-containing protein 10 [Labeo rohita]